MEKKKMKLWKKILVVLIVILIIYAVIVSIKFSILSKISKNYAESKKLTNYYYHSQTDNMNISYWRKDNIHVTNIKKVSGEGNITYWKNDEIGETLRIYEINKTYSRDENNDVIIGEIIPNSQSIFEENYSLYKFLTALHPACIISSGKFNEIECYNIYYLIDGKIKTEKIDKETGLLLYTDLYNGIRTIEYRFNIVTDKDVEKPDISDYKIQE